VLALLQQHLEAIYGVRAPARAESFVLDAEAAARLGAGGREQLLLCEGDGVIELALYIEPALLERARRAAGPAELLAGDLDGYCQVAEGVSHFVYLTRAAAMGRQLSLLELEAQAEIDKFATCLLHRWGNEVLDWARELLRRLFGAVRYLAQLTPELCWRYREANRLAHNYCQRLLRLISAGDLERLLSELRYSYRLGAEAKLRYLAQGA